MSTHNSLPRRPPPPESYPFPGAHTVDTAYFFTSLLPALPRTISIERVLQEIDVNKLTRRKRNARKFSKGKKYCTDKPIALLYRTFEAVVASIRQRYNLEPSYSFRIQSHSPQDSHVNDYVRPDAFFIRNYQGMSPAADENTPWCDISCFGLEWKGSEKEKGGDVSVCSTL